MADIVSRVIAVSQRTDHLEYRLALSDCDPTAPPPQYARVLADQVRRLVNDVRRSVDKLIQLACVEHKRGRSGIEEAAGALAARVFPEGGFGQVVPAGTHPQLDIFRDAASEIPWEALEESSLACPSGCRVEPNRVKTTGHYCPRCGRGLEQVRAKLALRYHLTHLVRTAANRPPSDGRDFLLIQGPGDSRAEPGKRDVWADHLDRLVPLVHRLGYNCTVLRDHNATGARVLKAIEARAAAGVYYFGHGYSARDTTSGCLWLDDGPLSSEEIAEKAPTARLVFINACHGAVEGREWEPDKATQSVASAFVQGGKWQTVIAPVWPVVDVHAAQAAEALFALLDTPVTLGEAMRAVREASLRRYQDDNEPDLTWMAYRYLGDASNVLPVRGEERTSPSRSHRPAARSRCFDVDGGVDLEAFAFDMDQVLSAAARRRTRQGRRLISLTDMVAGLARRGDLTRFSLRRLGIDSPEEFYRTLCGPPDDDGSSWSAEDGDDDFAESPSSSGSGEEAEPAGVDGHRWLPKRADFSADAVAAFEQVDQSLLAAGSREDPRVTEHDLLAAMVSLPAWAEVERVGVPRAADLQRFLTIRLAQGEVDANGAISLSDLEPDARRVIETAHAAAQQRGVFPISHRLLLAAFLAKPDGVAARNAVRSDSELPAANLFEVLMALAEVQPEPCSGSFGLSPDACERIVLPVLNKARARCGGKAVSEEALFRAFCECATPNFRDMLSAHIDWKAFGPETDSASTSDIFTALDPVARSIIEAAHELAQAGGQRPIPNRLFLAGFFADPTGLAARRCRALGVDPDTVVAGMIGPVGNGSSLDFPLDAQACAGPVARVIAAASERSPGAGRVTEASLLRAFCEIAPENLKRALRGPAANLDLDQLGRDDLGGQDGDLGGQAGLRAGTLSGPDRVRADSEPPVAPVLPHASAGAARREERVQFSVIAPGLVSPGSSFGLEVWAHLERERDGLLERIRRAQATQIPVQSTGPMSLTRGRLVSVSLEVEGLELLSSEDSFVWQGQAANATFNLCVPIGCEEGPRLAVATVRVHALVVAKLYFSLQVGRSRAASGELSLNEYRPRTAFVSYAQEDEEKVLASVRDMKAIDPDFEPCLEAVKLRAGERWEEELWRTIPCKDIFYLFWSEKARDSRWVEREWLCALHTKGIDFIHPIPLDPPDLVPPPDKLLGSGLDAWRAAYNRQRHSRRDPPHPPPSAPHAPDASRFSPRAEATRPGPGFIQPTPQPPPHMTPEFPAAQPGESVQRDDWGPLRVDAKARAVLEQAHELARKEGWPEVRTPHLFAALVTSERSLVGGALQSGGIHPAKLVRLVLEMVPPQRSSASTSENLPLSKNVQGVLSRARDAADRAQRELTSEADLVAGLFADGGGAVGDLLRALGLTLHVGPETVEIHRRQPGRPPPASTSVLETAGVDLTGKARQNKSPYIVGRDDHIEIALQTLQLKESCNPLLVGAAGVGKTAIVEGIAQRIAEGRCPKKLQSMRVVELSPAALVANTRYRGEFEERVQQILAEARDNVILFIDEIHTIIGAGAGGSGGPDAGNLLKAALARGDVRLIGATTDVEYRQTIERDRALSRRFQVQRVEPPTREATIRILGARQAQLEEHHGVHISTEAKEAAVDLSGRYILDRQWPAKARDVLDRACAAAVTDVEARSRTTVEVTPGHVARVVAAVTGVPLDRMTSTVVSSLTTLDERLARRIIGQADAIRTVAGAIRRGRQGLADLNRPWGVFLFIGAPGVGKTELAKVLADEVYGGPEGLIRFDMGEFSSPHATEKLVGAPPSYVGYEEGAPLVDRLRRRPYSLLLFDEIEHAHDNVLRVLLRLLSEGTLSDVAGNTADCRNSIVVMTSNALDPLRPPRRVGFAVSGQPGGDVTTEAATRQHLEKSLPPALLDRLDAIVRFNLLSLPDLELIAQLNIDQVLSRAHDAGCVQVQVATDVCPWLATLVAAEQGGARAVARAVDQHVRVPLVAAIERARSGQRVVIRLAPGGASLEAVIVQCR
jgi:ATP-dependent Clp protease ATP-binding subunit ClpC